MQKLLVANRSEIAIRVLRAVSELGLRTVAIYSHEDRFALHRFKSDESYLVGPPGGGDPVKSYLNIHDIIAVAKAHGVDAIHPGYGFLSENAQFARACAAAGIAFVGPTPEHLEVFGDKTAAKRLAQRLEIPTVPGTEEAIAGEKEVRKAAAGIGYPLMIKASFGGGGRGMRVVRSADELHDRLAEAQREAGAAFGRPDVFLERYVARAKHIEVQVLGDQHGNLVHLWERDCSVQRRHQKVVEMAPATKLAAELRRAICDAAVRLCSAVKYQCAGTVEFLVDLDGGQFYFIEVNPRVQVEHTVTEAVTGIDIVRSQILVTQGHKLHEPPISIPPQDRIETRGVAIQCRITTEDPENQFIPDHGRLSTYRSSAGFGIRLDGGTAFGGAIITPYFDSLLVKVTSWGMTLEESVRRMDRALREFRIRGVKTNIPFLENLILHPTFLSGDATTTFIDSTPALFKFRPRRDRATKILSYIGDVIVNSRPDVKGKLDPRRPLPVPVAPPCGAAAPPPAGIRQRLLADGPQALARWVRGQRRLLLTDTTLRDAHQSLLATRVRTYDMLAVADATARLAGDLFSLEMWGGATFDTAMRFLQEDPWERLRLLRARIPNIPFQMLLRASSAVGYTHYPDNVVREFIKTAAANGIDIFRIFDSLNVLDNMQVAMDAVLEHTGGVCEAAVCYTGDILDPRRTKYSLKYYVRMARELVRRGTHILAIKDMAGLCKPHAAHALVRALKEAVDVPIHFHTHDTSGIGGASVLRACEAGVDIADAAIASMSGLTSQPCLNSLVAALANTPRDPRLDLRALDSLSRYWESVRALYYPFEEEIKSPSADVYRHEMPGGQYTNLLQQARSLGLASRWNEVCEAYAQANRLLGDIVKVTPSSKVVGDLALFMVSNGLKPEDLLRGDRRLSFPRSVVEMMQGMLGTPEGGWPRDFQRIVLRSAGVKPIRGRPAARLGRADFKAAAADLKRRIGRPPTREEVLSYLLYPQVFLDYQQHVAQYDGTAVLPTATFFYGLRPNEEVSIEIEEGKTLIVRFLTVGELHDDGTRTIFFELNGQPREVKVPDRSVQGKVHRRPKADPNHPDQVAAPMPGRIAAIAVKQGDRVRSGQRLLSIEAMKMETAVYCPRDAIIAAIHVEVGAIVEARDLLVTLAGEDPGTIYRK